MSPGHRASQGLANVALETRELRRELDGRVEEPVIHGPHFDGDLRPADLTFGGSEPGHAPYHGQAAILCADNDIVNSKTPSERRRTGSISASDNRARAGTGRLEYFGTGTTTRR